jgi:ATP-dependent Clp protease protease subunit
MMNRLDTLLRINGQKSRPVARRSSTDDSATIFLYDVIDADYGIDAVEFNQQLASLKGQPISLRINSPGGDVFDGRAMASAITQHGRVTAYIDGLAASAATYVALAAARVEIADGAFFMIHNAWTMAFGNKEDLLDTAALLEKIDGSLIADYVRKTNQSAEKVAQWMAAETWFTSQEALDFGFVDAIFSGSEEPAGWNLSAFHNVPKNLMSSTPIRSLSPPLVVTDDSPIPLLNHNLARLRMQEIG